MHSRHVALIMSVLGILLSGCSSSVSPPTQAPTTRYSPAACAGTGVGRRDVAVSLDIGEDLTRTTYAATLHLGDELFVGANDCATYGVPSPAGLPAQLTMVGAPTSTPFGVVYRAAVPGRTTLRITCSGSFCQAPAVAVDIIVLPR